MPERALVLGGGGPAGIAWEIGLVAGLAAGGLDVMRADFVLGTSAGAFIGAQLATGVDPQVLAQLHVARAREMLRTRTMTTSPEPTALLEFVQRVPRSSLSPQRWLAEIGRFAIESKTIPEAEFVAGFAGMFGPTPTWSARYACTCVNAYDGQFKVWKQSDEVPLAQAVAASCSVPGIYPPISLKGSLWIDGGVRSRTNADCAAGHRKVIVAAMVVPGDHEFHMAVLKGERSAIEAAGGEVVVLVPDASCIAIIGGSLMTGVRGVEIAEAAIAQGQREAGALKAFWD